MRKWHAAVCCILTWMMPIATVKFRTQEMGLIPPKFEPTPKAVTLKPSAPKVIPNSISGFFGQSKKKMTGLASTTVAVETVDDAQFLKDSTSVRTRSRPHAHDPKPPDLHHRVVYAGLPRKLEVFPLPLEDSDHELQFNVSWVPTLGGKAMEYSLEVRSVTDTVDCKSLMCYDPIIPGNLTWTLIPKAVNLVADTCAVRPGCAYMVKLTSHPWDGHTSANLHVELDECVEGVCSCAHSPRLPVPMVAAPTVIIKGEMYANVTWTLPTPSYPQRLPSARLGKQSYIVSLGRQMISDAHVTVPWFSTIKTRQVDTDGLVSDGDTTRSLLLPLSERGVPNVKLLARVNLVDERGCVGPAGNATAFDPEKPTKSKFSFGVYAVLGALIGAWAMGAVFVLSARVVKRVLKSFRPAPVSAPLEPLRRRPAWFPLQLRT